MSIIPYLSEINLNEFLKGFKVGITKHALIRFEERCKCKELLGYIISKNFEKFKIYKIKVSESGDDIIKLKYMECILVFKIDYDRNTLLLITIYTKSKTK